MADDWQPIETAPKDRRILVYNRAMGVYSSQYTEEREDLGPGDMRGNSERPILWTGFPLGLTSAGLGKWYCVPSHWKPLPTQPDGEYPGCE